MNPRENARWSLLNRWTSAQVLQEFFVIKVGAPKTVHATITPWTRRIVLDVAAQELFGHQSICLNRASQSF